MTSPESLFATWLADRSAAEPVELQALVRAHPEHEAALRDLHDQWLRLEAIRQRFGLAGSLSERLRAVHGAEVDPRVELAEGEGDDFTQALIGRLSDHTPPTCRYRPEGEIARGGMGAVVRVWDEDLRRHLAMKVLLGRREIRPGDTPTAAKRRLARFLEEAQVTAQLDHPGIVPVHELGLDADGEVFFTMKLVKGRTLATVFDELAAGEGDWTQTRVLGLLVRVCEAMSFAHAKGVIHRDLKPTNVMVGSFGEVYVMDWGLARILGREDERDLRVQAEPTLQSSEVRSDRRDRAGETPDSSLYTMDGDVVGTPAYMSPEQAGGRVSEMSPASDVYALGAMLYHLLVGHMPYALPDGRLNNYAVWHRVQEGPPRPLHELAPDAPAELVAICERAMEREAAARYEDVRALAADLRAYLEGRVVRAYETGAWAEARKWVRRNKPLTAALAAALLLLVAGLAIALVLREQAQRNFELAAESERLARAETAKVLRLSDVKVLQELGREANELWPVHPVQIPSLESWLDRARALVGRSAGHRETLAEMRARAQPWSDEQRGRDRATHPRTVELGERRAELDDLIARLDSGIEGAELAAAEERLEELEQEVATLADEVESRRTWTFETAEDQWQHDVLAELIEDLEALEAVQLDERALAADHGWSVAKRLAFAVELEARFAEGGEFAGEWAEAMPAIRREYPGLELVPQMGLVPIGPDPASGLWEFWHVASGERPARGADGTLALTEVSGLVLVLIPGGPFRMGAQPSDPEGWNHDPDAADDEGPVHEVTVSPYLLSKYELTQGQWSRITGRNPSYYRPPSALAPSLLHPVEQVSWEDCMRELSRMGLSLPSEAQWEYAARGGTDTPWWTGAERESLAESRAANLADQAAARAGAPWPSIADWPELDDGYAVHAPVGTFAANPLGLHDVHGNVWESCLDGYDPGSYERGSGTDPVVPWEGAEYRVIRGGCYSNSADFARSAFRDGNAPQHAGSDVGVRPARILSG
jgi:formylglycine-generating enzyme required for sulfatase activity/serine/threonine protein kinase